jgi:hypothetical protein
LLTIRVIENLYLKNELRYINFTLAWFLPGGRMKSDGPRKVKKPNRCCQHLLSSGFLFLTPVLHGLTSEKAYERSK